MIVQTCEICGREREIGPGVVPLATGQWVCLNGPCHGKLVADAQKVREVSGQQRDASIRRRSLAPLPGLRRVGQGLADCQ